MADMALSNKKMSVQVAHVTRLGRVRPLIVSMIYGTAAPSANKMARLVRILGGVMGVMILMDEGVPKSAADEPTINWYRYDKSHDQRGN
jgi:hypothetical protein